MLSDHETANADLTLMRVGDVILVRPSFYRFRAQIHHQDASSLLRLYHHAMIKTKHTHARTHRGSAAEGSRVSVHVPVHAVLSQKHLHPEDGGQDVWKEVVYFLINQTEAIDR